jgi:hypothetical protein
MIKQINNNILLLFLCIPFMLFSQNESEKDSVQAKIKFTKKDNFIEVFAEAINLSKTIQDELNYSLLLLKKNASGNLSKNLQSGEFSLMVDEVKLLSKQQFNMTDNDEIKAFLFIRKQKKVISKDTLTILSFDEKYSNKPLEENNLELSGLIVENVMTKLGKDFYDFFSQINQLTNTSYPFIIIINEKPAIGGRNSEITILINDEIIYKFRTQPKEEYLYNNALEANKRIYNYNIKRKILRKKKSVF